jgi:hypothetical protein
MAELITQSEEDNNPDSDILPRILQMYLEEYPKGLLDGLKDIIYRFQASSRLIPQNEN